MSAKQSNAPFFDCAIKPAARLARFFATWLVLALRADGFAATHYMGINSANPTTQPLLASLQSALASIRRSSTVSALNQLRAFQNKLTTQVEPADSAEAAELSKLAEIIAGALEAEKAKAKGATQ